MRLSILFPLALTALLILPQARADDETESAPSKPDVAAALWESHAKTFDLDGDGKITWEEYQKVTSGFTSLDTDKDGAITKSDLEGLGRKLVEGLHGDHAKVFLGMPQGGVYGSSGTAGQDALLGRLLPLLLGGRGMGPMQGLSPMQGMHPMHGIQGAPPFPWMGGMGPMHGSRGFHGMRGMTPFSLQGHGMLPGMGACGPHGYRMHAMQILPLLLSGRAATEPAGSAEALEKLLEKALAGPKGDAGEDAPEVATTTLTLVPPAMKQLAAFGFVAQRADADGDHTITHAEWKAAVAALTKDDGSLDLSALEEGVGIHGAPLPGGNARIFRTLLDLNEDGKVDAKDLQGVFEKADANGDGKVTHDELMPAGMQALHAR